MSEAFASWGDVEASTGIQGVLWQELEERCRPGAGAGQSSGGWISDGRPLLEVLRQDWKTVQQLNTTHLELAAHLDAVWAMASPCEFEGAKDEIEYDVQSLPGGTLRAPGPVRLQLACLRTRGIQEDLLYPYDFNKGWNVQWNLSSGGNTLQIGGRNSSAGIVSYMKLFGFYESGATNEFRIDPAKLVNMLTNAHAAVDRRAASSALEHADGIAAPWWVWLAIALCLFAGPGVAALLQASARTRRIGNSFRSAGDSDGAVGRPPLLLGGEAKHVDAKSAQALHVEAKASEAPVSWHRPENAADEWARLMAPADQEAQSMQAPALLHLVRSQLPTKLLRLSAAPAPAPAGAARRTSSPVRACSPIRTSVAAHALQVRASLGGLPRQPPSWVPLQHSWLPATSSAAPPSWVPVPAVVRTTGANPQQVQQPRLHSVFAAGPPQHPQAVKLAPVSRVAVQPLNGTLTPQAHLESKLQVRHGPPHVPDNVPQPITEDKSPLGLPPPSDATLREPLRRPPAQA